MASHNIATLPRIIACVLLDLHFARQDWEQALEDAERATDRKAEEDAGDRMSEADKRIDALGDEFKALFGATTGIAWSRVEAALEAGLL